MSKNNTSVSIPEALPKIKTKIAKVILSRFEPDESLNEYLLQHPEAKQLSTRGFIIALVSKELFLDAFKFLGHALPKREAIWWACLAARIDNKLTTPSPRQKTLKSALSVAESWVKQPSEDLRRQAEQLAKLTNYQTAPSWAAQAAFWAGPSITPEHEPPVAPPEFLYAHAVFGALSLAAADEDPKKTKQKTIQLLQQGLTIAAGGRGELQAQEKQKSSEENDSLLTAEE